MSLSNSLDEKRKKIKIQHLFLIIAIPIGIYWSILLPPFQAPDEPVHFFRAYEISEGHFLSMHVDGKTGNYLPASINEFLALTDAGKIMFHYDVKIDSDKFEEAKKLRLSKERSFFSFPSSAIYSPIPYIPQAAGIFLGRVMDLPIYYIFLLGRWTNLLLYSAIVFFALKIIPKLKRLLFLLALMPMTIQQVSSLSADGVTFGLAFLLSAALFRMIFSYEHDKIKVRDIILLLTLTIGLTLSKSAYFTFFLLGFLIPVSKFLNKRRYWLYNSLIAISNLVFLFGWLQLCKNTEMATNPGELIKYILFHPFSYLKRLFATFIYHDGLYLQFFGIFGWLDTPSPYIIGFLIIVFMTIAFTTETRLDYENKETYLRGAFILLFFLLQASIIVTMLFIAWPQPDTKMVYGVQGRYFIPVFLTLAFSMYVLLPVIKKRSVFYFLVVVSTLLLSSYFMYYRYYW